MTNEQKEEWPEINGRYQIRDEIGRGGMAIVYLGYDTVMDRQVAVKLLPKQFTFDPQFIKRFLREAKVITALEHRAIVPVYDFGVDENQPFIVMRYMPAGSLKDRISQGPMSVAEAVSILRDLTPALDYAHAQGIIHRDIKPDNILFDDHGDPYLSDFGIVKVSAGSFTSLTASGGTLGTPAYMSPEQAEAKIEIDNRSDIYSVGIILFEMLTGDRPYKADTPMGLARQHITQPVPCILDWNSDLPPIVDSLLTTALAKNRDDRFPTANAFMVALLQLETVARKGAGALSPTIPLGPKRSEDATDKESRSRRLLRWAWLPILLLILSISFAYWTVNRQKSDENEAFIIEPTREINSIAQISAPSSTPLPSATPSSMPTSTFSPTPIDTPTSAKSATRALLQTTPDPTPSQDSAPTLAPTIIPTVTLLTPVLATVTPQAFVNTSSGLRLIHPIDVVCEETYWTRDPFYRWSYPTPLPEGWTFEVRYDETGGGRLNTLRTRDLVLTFHPFPEYCHSIPYGCSMFHAASSYDYWEVVVIDENEQRIDSARYEACPE